MLPYIFLSLFVGIPIIEIAIFIAVGDVIGLGATILLIFGTAIIGTYLLRRQGLATLARARAQIDQGQAPIRPLFDGVCILIAGCLLLTPGFLTDGLGFLLLVPFCRSWAGDALVPWILSKANFQADFRARGRTPGGPGANQDGLGDDVIDGDFVVLGTQDKEGPARPGR